MKKRLIKLLKDSISDGLEDSEILLIYSIIGKINEMYLPFETEYQIKEFRELQSEYFDGQGNAYTGTIFNLQMAERMLNLINQLESEL